MYLCNMQQKLPMIKCPSPVTTGTNLIRENSLKLARLAKLTSLDLSLAQHSLVPAVIFSWKSSSMKGFCSFAEYRPSLLNSINLTKPYPLTLSNLKFNVYSAKLLIRT